MNRSRNYWRKIVGIPQAKCTKIPKAFFSLISNESAVHRSRRVTIKLYSTIQVTIHKLGVLFVGEVTICYWLGGCDTYLHRPATVGSTCA